MNPPPLPVAPPAPKSSAVMAGWICVAIGFGSFWIFGLGFAFFSIAMVCAIVAMCANQMQRGLILLLSSFASLAICAVIFFVAIFGSMFGAFGLAAQKARPASGIAVLPFESLSSDKENAFFADGVYDGVSTKLAKVANLKVISHNSVAKYRGARNTQDIGRALNVAYVLEGSVRREAGRIHLNAQLIDTRTDAHVWAQEYDRDLSDVFTLQSEIAQRIADQLGTEVSAAEKAAIQEPPTTDLVAYDSYLRAKDLINGISWSTRAKEDLTQAVKLLDQAVTRDPLFFLAHGELAGAHDRIYFLGFDHTDARLKLSETAIQSVRRLRT